ncbi:MAG: hypothetical protein JNG83_10670 [Opitutaceae bacterium]|nr:hypothetical protein [Opitutaceae bacterium]
MPALFAALILTSVGFAAGPGPKPVAPVDLTAYALVLHVDQARGDDIKGDGSSTRPFASIVQGLEAAGKPTEKARVAILVSQGRYVQPTFALKPHVDLYGGFAAPGGKRDIYAHPTQLDGAGQNRIAIGADHARIDGFHFVNGRVRGKGAALLCDATSPEVFNCVFVNNRTLIPMPWNPPLLHETANDGGAVMCLNGAAPRLKHNLFYANSTECGRGAALAVDRRSSPRVDRNVFANNRAGLDDPMRSSDGGAVSWFDWSGGEFSGNVVVANEALTRNDAGGVFVALWSAPRIADNIIVANEGGDDAGGLFLGGQEHRYDAPLDAYPPADQFNIEVRRNVFVGNANSSKNSGAMRVTMETRAHFADNLIAENLGGFYIQRSEIFAERNTVWQDWQFLEDKPSLGPSRYVGNVLKGPVGPVESRVTFAGNMAEASVPGGPHLAVADIFADDALDGALVSLRFDPLTFTTTLVTKDPLPAGADFAGRPVLFGDNLKRVKGGKVGQWRVIARAGGNEIVIWGRLDAVTVAPKNFHILRTFTPKAGAPAGLGARLR